MKLLKIDNKLVALSYTTADVYNINDNLSNHTIRQIIYDTRRFAILTTTSVYYLHYKDGFKLDDLPDGIKSVVPISNIKFITDTNNNLFSLTDIGIITNSNEVFFCKIEENKFKSIKYVFQLENNVIAVSNGSFGYIYKLENDGRINLQMISTDANGGNIYVIGECDYYGSIKDLCLVDELPTNFITPYKFTSRDHKIEYDWNICSYGIEVGNVCDVKSDCIYDTYKVVFNGQPGIIELLVITKSNTRIHHIGQSHYHAEKLGQYNNIGYNIGWTRGNHHLFDKYSNKFVVNILLCDKHGKLRKWIPKGVLCVIIQFALCG